MSLVAYLQKNAFLLDEQGNKIEMSEERLPELLSDEEVDNSYNKTMDILDKLIEFTRQRKILSKPEFAMERHKFFLELEKEDTVLNDRVSRIILR